MKKQINLLLILIALSTSARTAQKIAYLSMKYDAHAQAANADAIEEWEPKLPERDLVMCVVRNAPQQVIKAIMELRRGLRDNDYDQKSKHLLLCGPSGSGKTELSKTIPIEERLPFFYYSGYTIENSYELSGIRNLERIFTKAAALNAPCVIVIDGIERIFKSNDYELREDALMIKLFELFEQYKHQPIALIGTVTDLPNSSSSIPSAMLNHFCKIDLTLPDEDQRLEAIRYHIEKNKKIETDDFSTNCYRDLARISQGLCYRNINDWIGATIRDWFVENNYLQPGEDKPDSMSTVTIDDFCDKLKELKQDGWPYKGKSFGQKMKTMILRHKEMLCLGLTSGILVVFLITRKK